MISRLNPLGRQVRRIIDRTGLTYTDFCAISGVSANWLHSVMHAPIEPKWATNMRKLRRATGCSYDDLFRM